MLKNFGKIVAGVTAGVCGVVGNAVAAVDLTSVTIDTSTPETLAATILAGLGVMWGIRKLVKTMNRS
jgi:hypothetical protein